MRKKRIYKRKVTYERFQGERYEDLAMKLSEWVADEHVRIRLEKDSAKEKDVEFFKEYLKGEYKIVFSACYMKIMDIIECPQVYQKFYGVSFWNPGDPNLIKIKPKSGFYRSLSDGKSNFSTFKKVRFDKNVEYWMDIKKMALLKTTARTKFLKKRLRCNQQ